MGYGMDEMEDGDDAYDALEAFEEERREQQADKRRDAKSIKLQIQQEVARQLSAGVTTNHEKVMVRPRGKMIERTCRCKVKFMARQADINRGWARSCSKSCAARFK
ncbi:hypothetical protein JLT2_38 [Paraglaciecola Antarctic JLT virus 2]|nr:hypothetical protein JLT2_38 [Paraglaciecola Antarctic JLT virus 2]